MRALPPTETERRWAERVIEAFEASGSNVVQLDGVMLDAPHLDPGAAYHEGTPRRLTTTGSRPGRGTFQQAPRPNDDGQVDHAAFEGHGTGAVGRGGVEGREQPAGTVEFGGRGAVLFIDDWDVRRMDAGGRGEGPGPCRVAVRRDRSRGR